MGLVLPKLQLRDHFKETTPIYISYFFCDDTLGCPKHTFFHSHISTELMWESTGNPQICHQTIQLGSAGIFGWG